MPRKSADAKPFARGKPLGYRPLNNTYQVFCRQMGRRSAACYGGFDMDMLETTDKQLLENFFNQTAVVLSSKPFNFSYKFGYREERRGFSKTARVPVLKIRYYKNLSIGFSHFIIGLCRVLIRQASLDYYKDREDHPLWKDLEEGHVDRMKNDHQFALKVINAFNNRFFHNFRFSNVGTDPLPRKDFPRKMRKLLATVDIPHYDWEQWRVPR